MSNAPKPAAPPFFVNAPFDIAFVGGISLLAWGVLRLTLGPDYNLKAVEISIVLMWVINWPHFSATLYRLFHSRENVAQYPATAYAIPFVVGIGALVSILSPALVAPYFVKLFLIWSPYHFSGQSVGISLIYARRAGVRVQGWQRLALSAFIFGTYAYSTLKSETSVQGASYYGITYPGLGVPSWVPEIAKWVMFAGAAAFVIGAARWSLRERRVFPLMVFLPGLAQYVWFVAGPGVQAFYIFVPLFHSLQYLPIAWAMQIKEKMDIAGISPSRRYVTLESIRWFTVNLAGGAGLFWAIPHGVALFGVPLDFATGVMIAGVQIHHFFVDGVIWKLKNAKVSSPLMSNILEWTTPRSAPARMAA